MIPGYRFKPALADDRQEVVEVPITSTFRLSFLSVLPQFNHEEECPLKKSISQPMSRKFSNWFLEKGIAKMKARYLLTGVLIMFAAGVLTGSSYAKIDPETIAGMWLFDEGKGNRAEDSSGNENTGNLMGGPKWVDGKFGGGVEFKVDGDHIALPNKQFFTTGEQTFVMSAKPAANPPKARGFLLFHGEATGVGNRVYILQQVSGVIDMYIGANIGRRFLNAGDYEADEWLHIALTRDFPNKKLSAWANGKNRIDNISVTINKPPVSVAPQIMYKVEPCLSVVDEVAIFDVLLSERDIQNIANKGLEEAINPTAVDLSGKLTAKERLLPGRERG